MSRECSLRLSCTSRWAAMGSTVMPTVRRQDEGTILLQSVHKGGISMAKHLFLGSSTAEGAVGLRKDGGSKRRQVAEGLVKEAGGKLEAFYFTFGDSDVAHRGAAG